MNTARHDAGLNRLALERGLKRERRSLELTYAPAVLLVAVVVFIPVGWLLWLSIFDGSALSLVHYRRMLENPSYLNVFLVTFGSSLAVTAICVVLGYPVAYLLSQLSGRAAGLLMIAVIMPFWTSLLVRTYAWLVLLQRRGLVNTWLIDLGVIDEPLRLVHNLTGTIIGMTHIMLPFMILPLYACIRAIDSDWIRAAESLGARPLLAFWRVFFPLSIPGLAAGVVLVFILCLGFYITPELLGGGRIVTVSMKIRENTSIYVDWGAASALGVVLLVVTLAIFAVAARAMTLDRFFNKGH